MTNAKRLLDLYHDQHAVFNDDVQGTGAVSLAAVMSAVGVTKSRLADQRIIIYGAGSAGLGIARQIRDGMVTLDNVKREDATKAFYLLDRHGLVKESLGQFIRTGQEEFARPDSEWEDVPTDGNNEVGLLEVVKKVKPTVLHTLATDRYALLSLLLLVVFSVSLRQRCRFLRPSVVRLTTACGYGSTTTWYCNHDGSSMKRSDM